MERKFKFSEGEYYHIYNRGTERRLIFQNESDYRHFVRALYLLNNQEPITIRDVSRGLPYEKIFEFSKGDNLVDIGAYCLMPNHFHLLLKEKSENGISNFMLKLLTSYSSSFNKKYDRTGSLFQGPFRAEHLDTDNYLKYMYAYIHLNPVKLIDANWREKGIKDLGKAKNFLYNYKYSSYLDYLESSRPESSILSKEFFPEYFAEKKEFNDFIQDWLTYQDLEK